MTFGAKQMLPNLAIFALAVWKGALIVNWSAATLRISAIPMPGHRRVFGTDCYPTHVIAHHERAEANLWRSPTEGLSPRAQSRHSHPGFCGRLNSFRQFWIPPQWIESGDWKPCGWRGDESAWCPHYAAAGHVEWWEAEIKKRGSVDAVYGSIIRRLKRERDAELP